jgi:serine/threonine protein kinase
MTATARHGTATFAQTASRARRPSAHRGHPLVRDPKPLLWHHGIFEVSAPHDPTQPRHSAGEVLADKYRILRLIGRGGMAEVYAAHHELLHQTVAIKMLAPRPGSAERTSSP